MSISLNKYTDDFFGRYLKEPSINEICYNGDDLVWYEDKDGNWVSEKANMDFEGASAFAQAAAAFKDDQIDKSRPILSCLLPTGERVQLVMPPATKREMISITIRKPSQRRFRMQDHINSGLFKKLEAKTGATPKFEEELSNLYIEKNYPEFLAKAVASHKNVVICGETGSGKTTFMKTLIDYIDTNERIITIEDVEEIKFYDHKNFQQLFYPSEAKTGDLLNSATLLKSCLRMKPDRILLAELRGAETYDFLNVLATGHGGSITSCHAGGVDEAFKRLSLMCLQNEQGQCVPYETLSNMGKDLIDVIVHIQAHAGKRFVNEIYYKAVDFKNAE